MWRSETKKIFILLALFFSALFLLPKISLGLDYTSSSFGIKDPVIDSGSKSSASLNFGLGQSLGQLAIGKSTSTSFQLWSGFQYFYLVKANVLTATSGDSEVALSWTVPQTALGLTITGYQVGTGTTSGSYTFQSVGNVTSYTKTGLTNGVPYFFIIKTLGTGGTFLVFSNEATATPAAITPPPTPTPSPTPTPTPAPVPTPVPPPVLPPTGTSNIVLSGLAYPGRTVTVLRDGVVAAVTIADPGAEFNVSLNNLAAGNYNITLYATDENGRRSPPLSVPLTLTDNVTTTVNNLFLGPTIGVSHSQIKKGDAISIFGFTAPSSDVQVFVNSPMEFVENIHSNSSGAYFKAFGTGVLEMGDHSSKSQTSTENLISPFSDNVSFKVGDTTLEAPNDNCKRSDLNCDGRVNLTDFSILLYYWNQSNPANKRADINSSGVVDLTDFSIMLYDWTG